ncbi:hypothetical protein BALOs_0675 [Halobacteriovorax sp. BALOs_7]|uniref:hypothetical protein n=1 Tax=Halobacteriovorax sp. BALOs_7 TaxID=2109558 RepID=UPI000EB67449|nr:hypothetical protein [Halobacteriovorax sp. BALOs_7]AYF43686.1 hypothetical protein BALOs_0675 [Halobacteriovorax sp. BALOs_7]
MLDLKRIYLQFSKKNFKFLNISSCFIADIFVAAYIYILYTDPKLYEDYLSTTAKMMEQVDKASASMMKDPVFQKQIVDLMIQSAITLICIYLIIHLFIYLFRFYDKELADGYLKFYCWTAGVLMPIVALWDFSNPLVLMFIIPGIILLFNAFGFKYQRQMKEE